MMILQDKIGFVKKDESGYTLIELTAVIIIMGIVMSIAYGVILLNARTFKYLSDTIVTRWDMRKAMDVLRTDCQELDNENIIGPLTNPQAGSRLYFKTLDGQKILYAYLNQKLMRFSSKEKGWYVLLKNLQNPPFRFLDSEMKPTSDAHKLVYIKVKFVVKNERQNPITLENGFYLRNAAPLTP